MRSCHTRRLLLTAGVAAAAAITATAAGMANANAAETHPVATAAQSAATVVKTAAGTTGKPTGARLGTIISTGMDASKISEWVIYGVSINNKNDPSTTFGFELSERHNNGTLTKDLEISEASGPEMAPGFHAVEGAYSLEGGSEQPAFGYFVGKPAKITGKVDGKNITARKVAWSENSSVTVFWFDNNKVTGDTTLSTVSAFDAAGNLIDKDTVSHE